MAPKLVLITGCSTGIGLETAVLLASDKDKRFKVIATMRNLAKKEQLEKAAGATLNKTLFIRELDVTKEASKDACMEKLKKEGGVDILINNAGMGQAGPIDYVSVDEMKKVFDTNVFGLIRLTQAVIPGMKAKKSGHILNITSMAGLQGFGLADIYCASKFAVEGFSESLAPYLQQFNINVILIEPGPVVTSFMDNMSTGNTEAASKGDKLTQDLQKKQFEFGQKLFSMAQSGKDIAAVIQKAILADKPQLRYQTSDALVTQASFKYKDPTGDSIVKAIVEQNGWDK